MLRQFAGSPCCLSSPSSPASPLHFPTVIKQHHARQPAMRQRDSSSLIASLNVGVSRSGDRRVRYLLFPAVPLSLIPSSCLFLLLLVTKVQRYDPTAELSKMISSRVLYSGAAIYATTSAFVAGAIAFRLPVQHNTVGPYNYHRLFKAGRRIPWRRLTRSL